MFKVLYAPFGAGVVDYSPKAHSLIVWEGKKGIRIIIQNTAQKKELRMQNDFGFEAVVEVLNSPPSLEFVKFMLWGIDYAIYKAEQARKQIERDRQERFENKRPFYTSFRGHGGHGVDAWD